MAHLKEASLKVEYPDISINSWVGSNLKDKKIRVATEEKLVNYRKIISDFNPDRYLLSHCTIVASVNVEDAPAKLQLNFVSEKTKKEFCKLCGKRDFYITPDTSKYVNNNGDAWERGLLQKSYKSFIGAQNYLEHLQDEKYSKGRILDAVVREVDEGKSLFVDILVATDKKHENLVNRISSGELTTLSMGSVVAFTICTKCGRVASDESELCADIRIFKKNSFIDEFGKKRVIAELCGSILYPESNKFIEGSWVEGPAFKGAVLRNILGLNPLEKSKIAKKYFDINIDSNNVDYLLKKVASELSIFGKKEEDLPPDPPETPKDESKPEELDTLKEDTATPEVPEVPDELKEMGEAPTDENIENTKNQPYKEVKNDIKETLKDQIKEELVKDLGTKVKKAPKTLEDADLNETLIKSSLINKLKIAKNIIDKDGFNGLKLKGYSKNARLKIAMLSKRYSINKEIYKILDTLDSSNFISFRRYACEVEKKLGRELDISERNQISVIISELGI